MSAGASIFGGDPPVLRTKKEHAWYQDRLDVAIRNGAMPCLTVGVFPVAENERAVRILAGGKLVECVVIARPIQVFVRMNTEPALVYTCGTHWVLVCTQRGSGEGVRWSFVRDVA